MRLGGTRRIRAAGKGALEPWVLAWEEIFTVKGGVDPRHLPPAVRPTPLPHEDSLLLSLIPIFPIILAQAVYQEEVCVWIGKPKGEKGPT